jgi:hypothetical protein
MSIRIRLVGEISGTRGDVSWPPRGSEMSLPDDEARTLISNGMAVPVPAAGEVEMAVLPDVEVEQRGGEVLTTASGPTRRAHRVESDKL